MPLGRYINLVNSLPLALFVRKFKTILDMGCGVNCPINYFITRDQRLEGLDISENSIARQEKTKYQKIYICDVRNFQADSQYELVTALDFVEHFTKEEGYKVLDKLEKIASQRVVIITPNGFVPQAARADNPFQEHKSGWSTEDFIERGYKVYGIFGPKPLRGECATLKYRPKILFGLICLFLYPLYFWLPKKSFSLLAVYDKK